MLGVVALGAGVGCNKDGDKKPSENKTAEKPGDNKAPEPTKPAGGPAPTTPPAPPPPSAVMPANPNQDDLALLPADAEVVAGVNWTQLTASALWKQFAAPQMMKDPKFQEGIGKIKTICGFDPMESITTISVGFKVSGDDPEGGIVIHGLDKSKSMGCFDKEKGDAEKDGSKVTIEDGVVLIQKGTHNTGFTFVNDSTVLVVMGSKAATSAGVKEAAGGKGSLGTSAGFVELYSKVNTTDSIWVLVNASTKAIADKLAANPLGIKVKAFYGSINITDGLSADVRVRTESADQASSAASMLKAASAQAMMFVDKINIVAEGTDIHATVALSANKLTSLASLAGGRKGAGGGGGLFGSH
jgi:hypothetical protein